MSNERERREIRKLFKLLFLTSRGGITRVRITTALLSSPMNANQLSRALNLDYKTVIHHLEVLTENSLVVKEGEGYGALYRPSSFLKLHFDIYQEIVGNFKPVKKA